MSPQCLRRRAAGWGWNRVGELSSEESDRVGKFMRDHPDTGRALLGFRLGDALRAALHRVDTDSATDADVRLVRSFAVGFGSDVLLFDAVRVVA